MNSSTYTNNLSALMQSLNLYYPLVLSTMSIVSNTLTFLVLSSRCFKTNPSGLLLRVKALVDMPNVCVGTLRFSYLALRGVDLHNVSAALCYSVITFVYSIDAFSSWLSALVSLDRLFLVLKPATYQSIPRQRLRRAQLYCIAISAVSVVVINTAKLAVIKYIPGSGSSNMTTFRCTTTNQQLVDWINFTITLFVPYAVMVVSTVSMSAYLIKRSKTPLTKSSSFIKTVLVLDLCFLLFSLPRLALQLNRSNSAAYNLALQFSTILKYALNSITVFLLFATNNIFRARLTRLCKTHPRITPSSVG